MITLTTDFGYSDHYAGVMKGAILKINPTANIVDITHGVKRHSIRHASYILMSILDYFPENSIHVFVIDPGVGTDRKGIVAKMDRGYYVGPDNGILTLVKSRVQEVYEIKDRVNTSTFDGRDVFAPVAAELDMGIFTSLVKTDSFITYPLQNPVCSEEKLIGEVIHIDHFGNVITNIPKKCVKEGKVLHVEGFTMNVKHAYANAQKGELLALINSEDLLEFAVNQGSASELMKMDVGDKIEIKISETS